jgi:hypothetical protein
MKLLFGRNLSTMRAPLQRSTRLSQSYPKFLDSLRFRRAVRRNHVRQQFGFSRYLCSRQCPRKHRNL